MKYLFYLLALALTFAGCKSTPKDEHSGHGGEEPKLKLTAYSQDFEVFAEADPFVAGKTCNVLSHFSVLPDFKALENGSIKIRLIVNNKEVSQSLEKPTRKGIFSFDISPVIPGKGEIIYDIKYNNSDYQLIVPDIMVFSKEEQADDAAQKALPSRTNTVVFTKEQTWKIEFASAVPMVEPFGQVIKTSAQVQSAQGDEIMVSAKASGMVIFKGDDLLEGKSVGNGQGLFTISGNGLADNSSAVKFAEAQNNYERAKTEFERQKDLSKDKIISEKDLQKSKNEYENSKAIYDNLSKNFTAGGQSVISPMNGFIKQLYIKNGQFVEAGQPLVSVSQNQKLLLRADVQQKYAPYLGSIVAANLKTIQDSKTYSLEELNGKIISYGRNTNSDNYLIPVSIQIDNKGSFIPGGYVELYLKTLTNSNAITVPNLALVEEQGNFYVFVQINPELFEKREVKTGVTDGLKTEIISGLSKNERVVTKGAILLKLAQSTGTLDAHSGHVH